MNKNKRKRRNQELTKHHILPKSCEWNSEPDNINWIERVKHNAIHTLFANDTPIEQIAELMLNINVTALTEQFKNDVKNLLSETDELYYYKEWIFIER